MLHPHVMRTHIDICLGHLANLSCNLDGRTCSDCRMWTGLH